jgi:simple sugar transport system permease protein
VIIIIGNILHSVFQGVFLLAVVRMSVPILLGALGDLFCERTGVLNIAVEGMMIIGAFTGFLGAFYGGSPYAGFFFAIFCGLLCGGLYAVLVVVLGCNQVVASLGFNMFGLGITSTMYKFLFGISTSLHSTENMPLLFGQNLFFYIALILVPVSSFIFSYTKWGLKLRAIGEYPKAAATVGINVYLHRTITCLISGALCALGGAFLTIGGLGYFRDNMVAGRGFIAFAAVIFGKYNPVGTLIGCLLFGFADALQLNLQAIGVAMPANFFIMMPYLITIAALLVFVRRKSFVPRSQGQHYIKGDR